MTSDELACAELLATITEYLDGVLDPAVRAAIEDHLEHCANCRAALAQFRRTIELAGDLACGEQPARPLDDAARRQRLIEGFRRR